MSKKKTKKPAPWNGKPFYMEGTEGTGEYVVVATTSRGRIGYRTLGDQVRIRIEPMNDNAVQTMRRRVPNLESWKQPNYGGQFRFSNVVSSVGFENEVLKGLIVIGAIGVKHGSRLKTVEVNENAPSWAKDLATKKEAAKAALITMRAAQTANKSPDDEDDDLDDDDFDDDDEAATN